MKSHPFELLKAFHIASTIADFTEELFTPSFTAFFYGSLFCSALIVLKVSVSGSLWLSFMIWNLFLAWIPFVLTKLISVLSYSNGKFSWKISLVWLAFFPNAPYLITDFVHLNSGAPFYWLDAMVLFSFAVVGHALGLASLLKMHDILLKRFGTFSSRIIIACVIPLTAFGVFLGRFLRWNSWDILTNPAMIFKDSINLFHGEFTSQMFGFTGIFTIFLAATYLIARKLRQHFKITVTVHTNSFKNF